MLLGGGRSETDAASHVKQVGFTHGGLIVIVVFELRIGLQDAALILIKERSTA